MSRYRETGGKASADSLSLHSSVQGNLLSIAYLPPIYTETPRFTSFFRTA